MNFFANLVRNRAGRANEAAAVPPPVQPGSATAVAASIVARAVQPLPANVHLISGHANSSADRIFRGLLVSMAEDGKVSLDPRYEQVCYLLKLMVDGSRDGLSSQGDQLARGVQLQPLTFQSRDAYDSFFATMLEGSKGNWAALYEGALQSMGGRGDMIAAALAAEQRQTLEGVERCVQATGMTLHRVPATATGLVNQPSEATSHAEEIEEGREGDEPATARDLIERARLTFVRLNEGLNEGDQAVAATPAPAMATPDEISQALTHNGDLSLTVSGALRIYASSPEVATQVAQQIMRLQAQGYFPYELPFEPAEIQSVGMNSRQVEEEWDVDR